MTATAFTVHSSGRSHERLRALMRVVCGANLSSELGAGQCERVEQVSRRAALSIAVLHAQPQQAGRQLLGQQFCHSSAEPTREGSNASLAGLATVADITRARLAAVAETVGGGLEVT